MKPGWRGNEDSFSSVTIADTGEAMGGGSRERGSKGAMEQAGESAGAGVETGGRFGAACAGEDARTTAGLEPGGT
jgi:hypothetical protein